MRLLLVEDNEADVFFFQEALREVAEPTELEICVRGDVALEHLETEVAKGRLPDLIVLDLNLPRLSGLEILERLRESPDLAAVPVIIFSSSDARADVSACYARGARAYLVKPMDFEQLSEMIATMVGFWRNVATERK